MQVKTIWTVKGGDALIVNMARVSSPANQQNAEIAKLLQYCIRKKHFSIFDMVNMCLEVNTTRDIAHQIIRHSSFKFQEFSQRYADINALGEPIFVDTVRLQDAKNRQNSIVSSDPELNSYWNEAQRLVWNTAVTEYRSAVNKGVAKELARKLLPEGLTPTRLYINGTVRSWLFYCFVRMHESTQLEHREIAQKCWLEFACNFPVVWEAMRSYNDNRAKAKRVVQDLIEAQIDLVGTRDALLIEQTLLED